MKNLILVLALICVCSSAAVAVDVVRQSDWSGGPATTAAGVSWGSRFDHAEGISWLAVPGQLALSSVVLATPAVIPVADGGFSRAESVQGADIDGDGDIDVVGAAYSGRVRWWRNEGGRPIVWTLWEIGPGLPGANQIFVVDLDGDQRQDVVGAGYEVGDIRAWGELTSLVLDTGGSLSDPRWQLSAEVPGGTALTVEARSGEHSDSLGEWAEIGAGPCPQLEGHRFVQYRLTLESWNTSASPIVREIELEWSAWPPPTPRRIRGRY